MSNTQPINVTAVCTRSDGWWAVEVPEIPGLFTQARRLDQVDAQVRDAAEMFDVQVDIVTLDPQLDEATQHMVDELFAKRDAARQAQDEASRLARNTVAALRSEGLTVRDVAAVTGVSPNASAHYKTHDSRSSSSGRDRLTLPVFATPWFWRHF